MAINVKSADDGAVSEITTRPTEASDSVLSELRRRAAAQQKVRVKAFSVGGEFGDLLQIRYKPLRPEQMDDFLANLTETTQQRAIEMNMDMMSKACVDIIGVDPNTREVTVLKDEDGHDLKLDNRLAIALGMPNPDPDYPLTAREVITLLFGNNAMAIGEHGDRVTEWMRSGVGESGES